MFALKEAREGDIASMLKANDQIGHPVGETLPLEQKVYWVKVIKSLLRAAIPLWKLDSLRNV